MENSKKENIIIISSIVVLAIILAIIIALFANKKTSSVPQNMGGGQNNGSMPEEKSSQSNENISYSGAYEINTSTSLNDGEFTSENADENAVLVSGDVTVNLENVEISKTGDSDGGDNSNFYGTNSALIAKDGAIVNLSNLNVETNASGANGIFSFGGSATTNNSSSDGTTVNISDSKIITTKDNSGGVMTTGGGIMNVSNLDITTSGTSSAAIRTDRGGGTVSVDGGTYTTNGIGSPSVYSTAKIDIKNAKLISNASEGIVIEGKNSVNIENTELIDSNTKLNGNSTTYKNVFLYQSMSGDAEDGESSFSAKNSKITTNNGDTFYVTNTSCTITLENNEITNNDKSGNFLRVQKDSWGNSGKNGGDVTLVMKNQNASGNIVVDSISTLDLELEEGSYFEGTINGENSAKKVTLKLDKNSKIKLTGDSYVTEIDDESLSNIDLNGYKLIKQD